MRTSRRVHLPAHLQDLGSPGIELASVPSCCRKGGCPTLSHVISKPQGFSSPRAGTPYPHSQVLGLGFPLSVERVGGTGHLRYQLEDLQALGGSENILVPLSFALYQGRGPLFPWANRPPFITPSLIGSLGLALAPSLPPLLCFVS